jgi:alpha-D-ribose 1-methylphosphonate 5-triphosphate synthase subunit PhnL
MTMTAGVVLEVQGLCKHFVLHHLGGRSVTALDGVDLTVHAGEHVALIGPSGAGKSSLLRSIWRSYRPSAGSVVLHRADGSTVDLAALPDEELADVRQQDIGYVSQFLRREARRTARDVVRGAARRRGLSEPEATIAAVAALSRVELPEELWDTYPVLLSGGEQQRVNLAAGTIAPPRLLLLDEPIASLDPRNRAAVLELIASLRDRGVAVISVFHDLDAVRRLADRAVLLRGGRVEADDVPDVVVPVVGDELAAAGAGVTR